MDAIASQITSLTIVYSTVDSDADQREHQSSASLTFVRGIHRGPVNSPRKWPVTRKMFPFDDVIMQGIWSTYIPRRGIPTDMHGVPRRSVSGITNYFRWRKISGGIRNQILCTWGRRKQVVSRCGNVYQSRVARDGNILSWSLYIALYGYARTTLSLTYKSSKFPTCTINCWMSKFFMAKMFY